MEKRSYTKIDIGEPEINAMRKSGKNRREIAERFGLTLKQVERWITRYNRKQTKLTAGIVLRTIGQDC